MKAILFALFLLPCVLSAQQSLEGLWEGTMTVGGIYSAKTLAMQLYITVDDGLIKGRSYVTLPDGKVLRMELEGYLYGDRSFSLVEVNFVGDPENKIMPEFNRQYQIVYKPDLWDSTLKGFWQEVTPDTFNSGRRGGRMLLRKRNDERA